MAPGKGANMNIRMDAFYGRQSVDRKDSISIESQLEFSKHEFRGENYKEYKDKGYSGKNTDRPKFQELIRDIERGLIQKVVVYKLDRISRSIIDFASMMEMFGRYNVEFVSATEKFDTSTPMGRAMLNICIVFAQLERETIQRRVQDAYYSRCEKGFHMSGKAPYGYQLEPTVVEGVHTKMMAVDPIAAEQVKQIFEMYAEPDTSYGDIARYFTEQGVNFESGEIQRQKISQILRNPVYAQSDLEMYEFFKTQGAAVVNDAADFAGTNGCYLYKGRDVDESKYSTFKDHILVLAPHEGLVSSETWLTCRKKLMNNPTFGGGRKAKNSWLSGKIKCARCGAGLMVQVNSAGGGYFRCRRRADNKGCEGCGKLRAREVENYVYSEMCRRMADFKTLTNGHNTKANPKLTALNVSLAQVEAEIEKLINTLMGANATLMSYANGKIEELDAQRQSLMRKIADLTAEAVSPAQMDKITDYLADWDNVSFEDRRLVVDGMISTIKATSESINIEWKI
jgi:DNA invertase Pin-like site-specific DNA recombinase